jgi:hypothetical protein
MVTKLPFPRSIFCIEGHWSRDLRDESTVKHALQLLKDLRVVQHYLHFRVGTRGEFLHRLNQWCQKGYSSYAIGYLAFHGEECEICLDGKHSITLDGIAEAMGGRGNSRFVHFSCCETLATDRRNLTRFLRTSGCQLVSGYRDYVDWVDTAAFETMLFRDLQRRSRPASIVNFIHQHHTEAWSLGRKLGWRAEYLTADEKG